MSSASSSSAVSSSSGQIFSQQAWEEIYPLADSSKRTAHAKAYPLHYLLAQGETDEKISHYIATTKINTPHHLTAKDKQNFELTPAIISVMRGRATIIKLLVNSWPSSVRREHLAATDVFGWTPLHHAVLSSEQIYSYLCGIGAHKNAKTLMEGTAENLKCLTGKCRNYSLAKVQIQKENGELVYLSKLSPQELQAATGLREYRDDHLYKPEAYKRLWQQSWQLRNTPYYTQLRQNPPKLIIGRSQELKNHEATWELFAGEDIQQLRPICEYPGAALPASQVISGGLKERLSYETHKRDLYLSGEFDAQEHGNVSRFANCGWPNAWLLDFTAEGTERQLLIAGEEIKKGDPIFWDYGARQHFLNLGKQVILGREKMREHFKVGLPSLVQAIVKAQSEKTQKLLLVSKISFPLNNPAALLDLHFSGITSVNEWEKHYQDPIGQKIVFKEWIELNQDYPGILFQSLRQRIIEFDQLLKTNEEIRDSVNSWVLEKIGNLTMMQILKGLDKIGKDIKNGSQFDEAYFHNLDIFLSTYKWEEDEDAPLGLKQRAQDALKYYRTLSHALLREIAIPKLKELCGSPPDSENFIINRMILTDLTQYLQEQEVSSAMQEG